MPALPRSPLAPLLRLAPLLWLAVMTALALWLAGRPTAPDIGVSGLVSTDHHPPAGSLVRLTLHEPASGADTTEEAAASAEAAWSQIVDQLGPLLPGHRPLAPPPAETRAWLDAHALYWISLADHAALARRFEPAALRAVVAGVRARLASPLFVIGGEDPRRDPLGLRSLGEAMPGRLGLLAPTGPIATAGGDLLAADGRTLLVYLRTQLRPTWLRAYMVVQLAARFDAGVDSRISVEVLPVTIEAGAGSAPPHAVPRLVLAGLAALTIVLAIGLRRVRAALAPVLVIGAGAPLALVLAGGVDPLAAPLLLALLALAVSLTPPVAAPGIGSSLRLAAALLPMLLLPYPTWQRWALAWALALLALVIAARAVTPALLRLARARAPEPRTPAAANPWPRSAALVAVTAALAGGAWSIGHVSGAILELTPTDAALAEKFFAPLRLAELRSSAADSARALAAAAADADELAPLVPASATRLDAPGSLLLAEHASAARASGLATLDLPGRVDALRVILSEHGLRPDAFGEFLRALDLTRQPTPDAALAGPLAGWFTAHLEPGATEVDGIDEVVAVSRVHLAETIAPETRLPARLRGPAVFAHHEQQDRHARLGLALAAGAWLSAFLIWLTARRLSTALTAALIGLATQAGALLVAVAAGSAAVVMLLPPLLLVGALAADAAARACQPVPADSPGRPNLALACQVAAAVALIASPDPAWRSFGLVLGFGAVLGFALATRAAPGLCALLRREEARP